MKKLSILFLSLVALVSIVSCNNDDDDSSTNPSFEGTWQETQEGETLQTLVPVENEGSCGTTKVEFKSGGSFSGISFYYSDSKCNENKFSGTWVKANNTLTIKQEGDTYQMEITELSNTTLTLKETDEEGVWYTVYTRK